MKIHPTAILAPDVQLGDGVEIGPYSIIGSDVVIGKNTVIGPHVVIDDYTHIGEGCRIFQFCSIGALPQDLKFGGEKTRVVIGNFNTIREFVTIHRSTLADIGVTILGDHNLIMAYCHIAHNCKLGNHVIMSNVATLAGHVHVEDYAIISGLTGVHQFSTIGAHAFIGGASGVAKDIPPYTLANGNHTKLFGLNLIGLQRRGFSEETIKALKDAYRIVFRSDMLLGAALEKVQNEVEDLPEVRYFINFIKESKRGICR
ncbi:MAG: acyl-ACP--UDP-N-acetylglucosamine O-acyltransferase [Syntrophaceae bacterium]|jgi:UDP-N-acetylglucosamine acyltransferase|nr:acyl-ACP--UDP-N-acetylglucosamine O-acyltransferase [Syntrophaceae bacterium]HOC59574.1 acyl-ACP--UDP-N-acetylglucosamine O-acyltransferase [Smithellaceae bacterium]HQM45392.1 acyl-ACP--UDP-N-acetylglucosamine O-acyltransferase [Smithellaceae bacterium]